MCYNTNMKTVQDNVAFNLAAELRRRELDALSNMSGYLRRIAENPITPENHYKELDWGAAVGGEVIEY